MNCVIYWCIGAFSDGFDQLFRLLKIEKEFAYSKIISSEENQLGNNGQIAKSTKNFLLHLLIVLGSHF